MKVVCYYAAAHGAHPACTPEEYDRIWPVMQKSVEAQGYDLIHLTSMDEPKKTNKCFRVHINPETVMFSREVAWVRFLESLDDNEQAVLVEPDCYLLKMIPPLKEWADMMLLRRVGKTLPCGFRLARRSALPFYRDVVHQMRWLDGEHKTFHGDAQTHHKILGLGKHGAVFKKNRIECDGVNIEIRNWRDYTSKRWKDAIAWNFKGNSKHMMLDMAEGKMPPLR